jgi:hypothetical protein
MTEIDGSARREGVRAEEMLLLSRVTCRHQHFPEERDQTTVPLKISYDRSKHVAAR